MSREEIMETLIELSKSQGTYTRLVNQLLDLRDNDPIAYNDCMTELESHDFKDPIDLILYLES